MKKTGFIGLLLLLLLLIPASHAQSDGVAFLSVNTAGVELQRVGTSSWVAINQESIIGVGDSVRTNATGSANISLFEVSAIIELAPETEIRISKLGTQEGGFTVAVELLRGTTQQTLARLPDTPVAYEFKMPRMTVLSQEGSFSLSVGEDGGSKLLVQEGVANAVVNGVVAEVTADNGVRTEDDGALGAVLPATSFEQLDASIDGISATFASEGDILLNVRQGPGKQFASLGSVAPESVKTVLGISASGTWYRIPFGQGAGWVSGSSLQVTVDKTYLIVFDNNYVESAAVAPPPLPVDTSAPPAAPPAAGFSLEQVYASTLQEYNLHELTVVAMLNQWRIEAGLWPLQLNPVLTRMARDQAQFVLAQPGFPSDPHIDAQGQYPRQRAGRKEYGWPFYGMAARMAVGENAYAGFSEATAVQWWKNSPLHNSTVTNPGYREIGVAAIPHPLGTLYFTVFGSRPNVFPVLLDPVSNTLYLSSERYQYAPGGDWIVNVEDYQILPNVLSQLEDSSWKAWNPLLTISNIETFAMAFREAGKVTIFEVNPNINIAWLPTNLPGEQAPAAPSSQPTPFPTNTPRP